MTGGASLDPTARRKTPAPLPVFLKLDGRPCLVVGAGAVAQPKIESLLAAGGQVTVVAPAATNAVRRRADGGALRWEARPFVPDDLEGVFLVIAATSDAEVNRQVFQEARRRNVLINAVDDPPHCDFYYGAVVRRGSLQIAISTDGKSPALAQRVRREIEQTYGPEYEPWLEALGEVRGQLFASTSDAEARRQLLHDLASCKSFEEFARRASRARNGGRAR
jgi:precorrin-2 dehydrogenase/sirohydrochlorin ferrochelatase